MAVLDKGRISLVGETPSNTANLAIRIETYIVVVAVIAVLFLGVRRVAGRCAAAGIAGAAGLALLVAPP
jgi:hypothetical protein